MTQQHSPDDAVAVAGAPAIPGLTFRRFRGAEDYPQMAAVRAGSQAADGLKEGATVAELAGQFDRPQRGDPALDLLMVEVDSQLIGYNYVRWFDLEDGSRVYRHSGFLLPTWRGRGIGRAMV